MGRRRTGTTFATTAGGAPVVEAPGAYSSSQAVKARRPRPHNNKSSLDGGDNRVKTSRGGRGATGAGGKRPRTPSWEREYQQIWKSVYDLGAEQFTGKDKRAYEARKIVERGGRAPKEATMPYVMLQGMRKKAKQRQDRREAMEAEAGLVTGTSRSMRRKSTRMPRGRSGGGGRAGRASGGPGSTSSFGPAPSMGVIKSGVLHVSRKATPLRSQRASEPGRAALSARRGGGGGGEKERYKGAQRRKS